MTCSLIIGAGSIGSRHERILSSLGHECAFVSKRTDLNRPAWECVGEAVSDFKPSYVVIANETVRHQVVWNELTESDFTGRVLVEKPAQILFTPNDLKKFETVGIAFNLRFHPVLTELRSLLQGQKILSASVYAGQDLTSWRPDRSVGETYSARLSQGGGALRDLSHELDYVQWLCGAVTDVVALGGRISQVTIDSDDSWAIILRTTEVPQITVQLNYLDKPGTRAARFITENQTIVADFSAGTLEVNGDQVFATEVDRDTSYQLMHLDMLGGKQIATSAESSLLTDSLIRDIELSATEKRWVVR